MSTPRKRLYRVLIISISILLVLTGAAVAYVRDYYPADPQAVAAINADTAVHTQTLADGTVLLTPSEPYAGLIFYPGGKVDHLAYLPLMNAIAEKGIACALVPMPARLAVLDMHAADGIAAQCPSVTTWYIGGHSLGGAMSASHLAKRADAYQGLVLLAAYSTADLSDTSVRVLSVYGSEDTVLNRQKYQNSLSDLPDDFTEVIIDGGCHAYFGTYGAQKGDGIPTISNEEQIQQTADAVVNWIAENRTKTAIVSP